MLKKIKDLKNLKVIKNKIILSKSFFTKRNIFVGIIALLFLIMFIQIQSVLGSFSFLQGRDTSLITEIGQIKDSYLKLGEDLNAVRDFLRMPRVSYVGFTDIENEEENKDKNTNDVQLALFKYIEHIADSDAEAAKVVKNKNLINSLADSKDFAEFLKAAGLSISKVLEDPNGFTLRIDSTTGGNILTFYLSKDGGDLFYKTLYKKNTVKYENFEGMLSDLKKLITSDKDDLISAAKSLNDIKSKIAKTISSQEVQKILKTLQIELAPNFVEKDLKLTYSIFNRVGDLIGEIVVDTKDLKIILIDKNDDSITVEVTDIATAMGPFLGKLDTKTFVEKKALEAVTGLKETISDKGFKLLLSEAGLTISENPREDKARIYYDLSYKDGKVISTIVLEKATGTVNIVKPDGTNPENLLLFDPEVKKKISLEIPENIPDYGDELLDDSGTFNVLIAGKHGNLVDTMIFAHINENKRTIRMISVPRDLFYNGRKINSLAYYYGMPELKNTLSKLSGYKLDKYILIDMYAFIDVIDLIGGIDIHLNKAVIDPTYKTVDNGKAGTLHYEPGDYHLSGVEALRLARTRHTSSDFARAERQQVIIKSIQTKAKNFGLGDADTIYEIVKTVLNKTETDISLDEAIAYYFRYQNYEIVSNDVMSSGNIFYTPPYITEENCQKLIDEAYSYNLPKPECEGENHAYTLLPIDNNWNLIKWFFRMKFEEK